MTTIVYKDGILAGDSQYSRGDTFGQFAKKVFNIDGTLLGVCGAGCTIEFLRKWVKDGCDPKTLKGTEQDYDMIVVPPKGTKLYRYSTETDSFRDTRSKKRALCIGSGWMFAAGALEMGASPEEAVKAAMKLDLFTGGKIRTVSNLQE